VSRKRIVLIVGAIVLVVGGVVAFFVTRAPANAATATIATRTVTETAVMSGRVVARRRIEVGVSQPGIVAAVAVDEGQQVLDGALLLQLDDRAERAALAQARAQVQQAKAQLDDIVTTSHARAVAAAAVAIAETARAEQNATRLQRLLDQGATTVSERDSATTALAIAKAQQVRAQADVDATTDTGTQAALARAAVAVANAAAQQAEARLALTQLHARGPATVLQRSVEPGEAVAPGRTLLSLAPRSSTAEGTDNYGEAGVEILVEPDERVLAVLAVGQKAQVSADAFVDKPFAATVTAVAPLVDKARGTVEVRLRAPSPPSFLRTDMTVSVEVVTGTREGLVVPARAVRGLSTAAPTILIVEDGHAVSRAVSVEARGREGDAAEELVVVVGRAGALVDEGDLVVLDPKVKDGAALSSSSSSPSSVTP
jgi:HlyD family secretion protein